MRDPGRPLSLGCPSMTLDPTAFDALYAAQADRLYRSALGIVRDPDAAAENLKTHLLKHLNELSALPVADRLKKRYEKFRAHGRFLEKAPSPAEMAVASANGAAYATAAPAA